MPTRMIARAALLLAIAATGTSCLGAETSPPETDRTEFTEVRLWDSGCYNHRASRRPPFPPDTLAVRPGRPDSLRVVSLGGCADAWIYERERQLRTVLDTLSQRGAPVVWPFDDHLMLSVGVPSHLGSIVPLEDVTAVALYDPGTTFVVSIGLSDEYGIVWLDAHNGPHFRLTSVQRGSSPPVAIEWPSTWPHGSGSPDTTGISVFDSVWQSIPAPPLPLNEPGT